MITLEAVHKSYRSGIGEKTVLNDVNAHIEAGDFAVLFGRSGSGKSSLLHCIGALDSAYQGNITVNGQILHKMNDHQRSLLRSHSLGFVFQTPFFPAHLTCLASLILAARLTGSDPSEQRMMQLLERVGLENFGKALPSELSGGQLQRLALARALVGDPPLLLCDEPTGNLDRETGEQLIEELKTLHSQGKTLFIASHDRHLADCCGRLFRLQDGSLQEETA